MFALLRDARRAPLLAFRRQRRQLAVCGIDDQRGAADRGAAIPPEVVVGARIALARRRILLRRLLLGQRFDFILGELSLVRRDRIGSRQGRGRRVGPHTLQVGFTPCGARGLVVLVGGRFASGLFQQV